MTSLAAATAPNNEVCATSQRIGNLASWALMKSRSSSIAAKSARLVSGSGMRTLCRRDGKPGAKGERGAGRARRTLRQARRRRRCRRSVTSIYQILRAWSRCGFGRD